MKVSTKKTSRKTPKVGKEKEMRKKSRSVKVEKFPRSPEAVSSIFPWRWWLFGLIFCLVIAAIMRLPLFTHVPGGLNRDEAALGYNAYSILKTGKDEYGKFLPVTITSFGDEKLPGYVYTLVPFIDALGLNIFAIRLPSLLSGFVIIFEMGVLALFVGRSLKFSQHTQILLSTLVMLFLAVSPWANHFSRVAYEAHLAMAFFLLGLITYISSHETLVRRRQNVYMIVTAASWSFTLLTYHSYQIFMPFFVVALAIFDWQRIKKFSKTALIFSLLIGALTAGILLQSGIVQANAVKNSGITPFQKSHLAELANEYRTYLPGDNALYERILVNPATEAVVIFAQNWISIISGTFFFIQGSGHGDHNPGNFANFPLFIAPLLGFGLLQLWENRQNPYIKRIGLWISLGMIPAALTIQPLHEIRLSPIFPAILLVSALGATILWTSIKARRLRQIVGAAFLVIIALSTMRIFIQYLFIIPAHIDSNEKYHLLARSLAFYQKEGYPVITQSPTSSPYIWYLVENKYDPKLLQSQIERYPIDSGGFIHVKRIGNVYFETIVWDELFLWSKKTPLILIFTPKEIGSDHRKDPRMTKLDTIVNEHGEVAYEVWKYDNTPIKK